MFEPLPHSRPAQPWTTGNIGHSSFAFFVHLGFGIWFVFLLETTTSIEGGKGYAAV